MNKENRLKLFENELNDIHDENIRDFAKEVLINADDYFFKVPASSSGKYHPSFSLGDGGLVRHTRCVVFFAESIAESFMMSQKDKDLLILAAIAHDIKKQGDGRTSHTQKLHPKYASDYLTELDKKYHYIYSDDLEKVKHAIERHMGKWGVNDGLEAPETEFDKCLQSADYNASRKEILDFKFRETKELTEDSPEDAGNYKFTFGKHTGKTIKELSISNPDYLDWILGQPNFNQKECLEQIKKFKNIV